MLYLHRKKVILICFLVQLSHLGFAQKRVNEQLFQQDYDEKIVHFGYYIGPHVARYNLKENQQFQLSNPANPNYLITSPVVPGLWRFGGSVNVLVNDNFDFQTCLGASIYDRKIRFYKIGTTSVAANDEKQEGNTAWLDFPAHLKFKSERRHNTRMYMFSGFRYATEIGQTTKRAGLNGTKINDKKKNDFMIEYGVGLEKFTPFAKISPEICFSHGIINLLGISQDKSRIGLYNMTSNTVTLFIYFE